MARNVEIKARAQAFAHQSRLAAGLATGPVELLRQRDTFFYVPTGRLKLREFANAPAELIQYDRPNRSGPSTSTYTRIAVPDPVLLKDALGRALGVRAVVEKERRLLIVGCTRIHLDRVAGLGEFIELEVVLGQGEQESRGARIAHELMAALGIAPADLIEEAYVDLLLDKRKPGSSRGR
jgi:adenylate cyclase class IV